MAAKQLMLPAHRVFNSDGAPEAGATAELYLSGTLTPALFYSDSSLTSSIGSVITANSAGRFDPMPYGDSNIAYRLITKDAEDDTIDDIDPFYFGLVTGVDGLPAAGQAINPMGYGFVIGADPANIAINVAAMAAMKAALNAAATNLPSSTQRHLGVIRFPPGKFMVGDSGNGAFFDIDSGAVIIEGAGGGWQAGYATEFLSSGCTVFRVQSDGTAGAEPTTGTSVHGGGSVFRDFNITGSYTTAEAEYHGIEARATISAEGVFVQSMSGDGFHLTSNGGGNVDESYLAHCQAKRCRKGFYFDGNDSNASTTIMCKGILNRQWDLHDSSFLGNTHIGFQGSSKGSAAGGSPPSAVTYGGGHYGVIRGQESGASTNNPSGTGVDNTYWYYIESGTTSTDYPDWVSGTTYRAGGSFLTDNTNQKNMVFVGCYDETNGTRAQVVAPAIILGGFLSISRWTGATAGWGPAPSWGTDSSGRWRTQSGLQVSTNYGAANVTLGFTATSAGNGNFITCTDSDFSASGGFGWQRDLLDTSHNFVLSYGYTNRIYTATGPNTTDQFGTGAAVPYAFYAQKLKVGNSRANARALSNNTTAGTAESQGHVEFNRVAAVGSSAGWIGTAAGSAMQPFGVVGMVQTAHQANSTAPDVATLVTDFNALLAKLQTAKVMA